MEKLLAVLFTLAFAISVSSLHGKLKDCRTSLGRDEGPKRGPRNDSAEIISIISLLLKKPKLEADES